MDKVTGPSKRPDRSTQGSAFQWSEPEPWPTPVSGQKLLDSFAATFSRYVILPPGAADAMALWILYTWTFDAFSISPILAVTSPAKRCGKTTVVTLLQALARRSLAASSITPAALFRFVELEQPTLIVDEADRFLLKSDELTGILNAGHTRATARVIRSVGEHFEPRMFSTWCPKAIALIGTLDETLQDRSIEVRMRRKTAAESAAVLRSDRILAEVEDLRRQAARWACDNTAALADADPQLPDYLHSRAQDNWRPLFAIATVTGHEWIAKAHATAQALARDKDDDEDLALLLLSDIRRAFRDRDRLSTAEIVNRLQEDDERPWSAWLATAAAREIAKLLRPFRIRSRKIRIGTDTVRGYLKTDLNDAFQRYLPAEAEQVEQTEQI